MKKGNRKARLVAAIALTSTYLTLVGCSGSDTSSEALSFIERAETYENQGQYRSALLSVQNAIQAEPNEIDHIAYLAELYLDIGASERASELLAPWLSQEIQTVALPLAKAYVAQGKHLSARETITQWQTSSPAEQLEKALVEAEIALVSGNAELARSRYEELVEANPQSAEALIGLMKTHLRMNNLDATTNLAERWTSNQSPNAEILHLNGVAHYRKNQLDKAADILTSAVAAIPNVDVFLPIRREVLTTLSSVLTEQGRITEAQVYNKILAENSNTEAKAQVETAMAAIEAGDVEGAKTILRDLLELNPNNRQVALMLGALSAGTGELEEGERLLTENLDPETTPTQIMRLATMAQIDVGDRMAALKTLERAMEARPNDIEILAMHGILAMSLQDQQEAGFNSLSRAVAAEPERVRLRLPLAQYHLARQQTQQALGQLRQAFSTYPDSWATTGPFIKLLLQQGEVQEAEEIRDSLINGYPEEKESRLLASLVDLELDRLQPAEERLRKLIADEPEFQAPRLALGLLYEKAGDKTKAIETLLEAAEIGPDTRSPFQRAAKIFAEGRELEELKLWLTKVASERPELRLDSGVFLSIIALREGDIEEAKSLLAEWKGIDSDLVKNAEAEIFRAEAVQALRNENFDAALLKADQAAALFPEQARHALLPVFILQRSNKIDEAITRLDDIEKRLPPSRDIIQARASLLERKESPQTALTYLRNAWASTNDPGLMPGLLSLAKRAAPESLSELTNAWLETSPKSIPAHMARANWLLSANQSMEAASHYSIILDLNGNYVPALNNLAWVLRESDTNRALSLSEKAYKLAPGNPAILDTHGWILHLAGRQLEAEQMLSKAHQLAPSDADIKAHLETVRALL